MKRLLLPLLAAIALSTAVNAEVKLKPTVSNFPYVLYKHLELGFDFGYSIDRTTLQSMFAMMEINGNRFFLVIPLWVVHRNKLDQTISI